METNTHWHEWREAVRRTGYTPELQRAADVLLALDGMTPQEVESLFAGEPILGGYRGKMSR